MTNHFLNQLFDGVTIRARRPSRIGTSRIAFAAMIFACAHLLVSPHFTLAASAACPSAAFAATLNLTSNVISGGDQLKGLISLSNPTIVTTTFDLSAVPDSIVKMHPSVTVRAGESAAMFSIATTAVNSNQQVTIIARPSGPFSTSEITARLSVVPGIVKSLALDKTSAVGGTIGSNVTGTVTLEFKAPPDGAQVSIQSTVTPGFGPAVFMQSSVDVPAGATSTTFSITTTPVIVTRQATISATLGGVTKTANLTIEPLCVANLIILAGPAGPFEESGSLILNAPARPNTTVTLFSSHPTLVRFGNSLNSQPTASLSFNEGERGPKTFQIIGGSVSQQTVITITARVNGSECVATRQIVLHPF